MKKIISVLMIFALLMLSACAKEAEPVDTAPAPTSAPQISGDPAIDQTDYRSVVLDQFNTIPEAAASDFTYTVGENGVTIDSYLGSGELLRLPETIEGKPVIGISDGAFAVIVEDEENEENEGNEGEPPIGLSNHEPAEKTLLKALYIPDSVTQIGVGVLSGCNTLVALRTPFMAQTATAESQFLGYLFGGQSHTENTKAPSSLLYVCLGDALTSLPASAFSDCDHLVAVLLGDRISKIGDFSFYFCKNLKYVNMDRLTQIGEYAFANCPVLVRVNLSTSCISIGLGAFQGCGSVSSMVLPFVGNTATQNGYLGYIFGAKHVEFTAGYIPAYLRKITLLDTCTVLHNNAFFECSSLTSVTLPNTLTEIGIRAFEGCDKLPSITLPASLRTIRENAFVGCTGLERVAIGEGLTSIGINAFYNCTALREIYLPTSLTSLPASAFANCVAMHTVSLGGVTSVGKNAFRNCNSVAGVITAQSVSFESGNNCVSKYLGIDSNEKK